MRRGGGEVKVELILCIEYSSTATLLFAFLKLTDALHLCQKNIDLHMLGFVEFYHNDLCADKYMYRCCISKPKNKNLFASAGFRSASIFSVPSFVVSVT